MLLRRVMDHVRNQNWAAVATEFVIVVVGVFLGIEVSNWNEERGLRAQREALMQGLKEDFGFDAWAVSGQLAYHGDVYRNAVQVLKDLSGEQPLPDEQLVIAAFRASQFSRFSPSSDFQELVATGGLKLVEQSELGRAAKVFYENTVIDDMQAEGKSSAYRRLFRSILPIDVQVHVETRCGDRGFDVDEIIHEIGGLSYACDLEFPPERIAAAAEALRQRPELTEALRHRAATLLQHNDDLEVFVKVARPFRISPESLKDQIAFRNPN